MEPLPPYDIPPSYNPSVTCTGRLLCKRELLAPGIPSRDHNWHRVEAELRGTLLLLSFVGPTSPPTAVYSLQAADAGLAPDYKRRADVFRARLEGEQLLFTAPDVRATVAWVEVLLAAITVSDPLEERAAPMYPALPSGRRATGGAKGSAFGVQGWWSGVAWRACRRREWLLEIPRRTLKERWWEAVHGAADGSDRRSSTASTTTTGVRPPRSSQDGEVSRCSARCWCPSATCRGSFDAPRDAFMSDAARNDSERKGENEWCDGRQFNELVSSLAHSIRCTPKLIKWSRWKNDYYVKGGQQIPINPPRPPWNVKQTTAFPAQGREMVHVIAVAT